MVLVLRRAAGMLRQGLGYEAAACRTCSSVAQYRDSVAPGPFWSLLSAPTDLLFRDSCRTTAVV